MTRAPASQLWFLYIAAGMGCPEIGKIFGRDASTVRLWLVQAGIPTRARGSNTAVWLKPGHRLNIGRTRSADEVRNIRAATMRRGGVPYLRGGKHWLSGAPAEANPNWKGGITADRQAFYATPEWKAARAAVWKRAGACCERCDVDFNEHRDVQPHLHHIVSFAIVAFRAEPSNLALLCRPCHLWVHSSANVEREFHRATPSLFDLEEAA